jgi:hypothetical protein
MSNVTLALSRSQPNWGRGRKFQHHCLDSTIKSTANRSFCSFMNNSSCILIPKYIGGPGPGGSSPPKTFLPPSWGERPLQKNLSAETLKQFESNGIVMFGLGALLAASRGRPAPWSLARDSRANTTFLLSLEERERAWLSPPDFVSRLVANVMFGLGAVLAASRGTTGI